MEKKVNFWAVVKAALLSPTFKDLLKNLIIKALKLQMLGGFRGWLIGVMAREFSEETIEVITDVGDYLVTRSAANDTATNEDRDEASDILTDLMR